MARYEHTGNANYTATLNADITNASASMTLSTGGGTGFPTGGTGPFWLVIDPGNSLEEKVLATARSGDSITGLTRGQDNTSAVAHSAGAKVYHVFVAFEADEANAHINTTTRDNHTQYVHTTTARTISAAHTFTGGPTFSTTAPTFSAGAALGTGTFSGAATLSGAVIFSGTPVFQTGGSLAGTFTGTPTLSGAVVFSGNPNFTGSPTFNTGTPTFNNGAALGTGTYSGNLTFSGGPTITGSVSGLTGGELRIGGTGASGNHAITTQASSSPDMGFMHRATSNTGSWSWRNGTNAATTVMSLTSAGALTTAAGITSTVGDVTLSNGQLGYASTNIAAGATAGGGATLPATVNNYLIIKVDGAAKKVPYYNN